MTDTTNRNPRRGILPEPCRTEADEFRYYHRDLAELPADRAWAEAEVLRQWLAVQIFNGQRPRYCFGIEPSLTDQEWVRQRIDRLQAHLRSRRAA
jgi:hypothetical protein